MVSDVSNLTDKGRVTLQHLRMSYKCLNLDVNQYYKCSKVTFIHIQKVVWGSFGWFGVIRWTGLLVRQFTNDCVLYRNVSKIV